MRRSCALTNPYETPAATPGSSAGYPGWYLLFCRIYSPVWWVGTGLVVLSWIRVVPPLVGWIGFGITLAVWAGGSMLPKLVGIKAEDFVALNSQMLLARGENYLQAMQRFAQGATLMYDGICFGLRPPQEIASALVAPSSTDELKDQVVRELAAFATGVFDNLKATSPEFAATVLNRTVRISLVRGGQHRMEVSSAAGLGGLGAFVAAATLMLIEVVEKAVSEPCEW